MVWLGLVLGVACSRQASDPAPEPFGPPPSYDSAETGDSGVATDDTSPMRPTRAPLVRFDGPPPANLLVLSVDTWRRDGPGYMVDRPRRTPFIDRLAHEGVALVRHRSCSNWTLVSMMCAMSGQSTVDLGYHPMTLDVLPENLLFLADYLRDEGFASAFITANKVLSADYGFGDNYDVSQDHQVALAATIIDSGLVELDAMIAGGTPWMLHLHFMEPHIPYDPPAEYLDALAGLEPIPFDLTDGTGYDAIREQFASMDPAEAALVLEHLWARYLASGRYLDDQLVRLFDELEARGVRDDVLVLLFADHGEQFFEHGNLGHGTSLMVQEVAVPALLWAENMAPPVQWEVPTTHSDLAPTVLTAMGFDVPEAMTGAVLGAATPDRVVFAWDAFETRNTQIAAHQGGVAYVMFWDGRDQLYRLRDDPEMMNSVFTPIDPDALRLWEALEPEVWRFAELIGQEPFHPGPEP